jgi:hypothetical protein
MVSFSFRRPLDFTIPAYIDSARRWTVNPAGHQRFAFSHPASLEAHRDFTFNSSCFAASKSIIGDLPR